MRLIYLLSLASILLAGCSPNVQYIGRTYQSTEAVDLYFNPSDIKREYETMGRVEGTQGMLYTDYSDIQEEIVKVARRKGADGVLIHNMEKRTLGQNTNSATRVGNGWLDAPGKQTTVSTSSSTNAVTQNALQADFIKYK